MVRFIKFSYRPGRQSGERLSGTAHPSFTPLADLVYRRRQPLSPISTEAAEEGLWRHALGRRRPDRAWKTSCLATRDKTLDEIAEESPSIPLAARSACQGPALTRPSRIGPQPPPSFHAKSAATEREAEGQHLAEVMFSHFSEAVVGRGRRR